MKQFYPILFFICLCPAGVFAQADSASLKKDSLGKDSLLIKRDTLHVKDSIPVIDSLRLQNDSLRIADSLHTIRVADSLKKAQAAITSVAKEQKEGEKKIYTGQEALFYYLIFLLVLFGLLRRAFPKYFYDLFRVFFKTTLKQRQTQEQLLQSPLPSIFMNSFFILSAGLYINFILQHFQLSITENFWLQYFYCASILAAIYLVKYIGLKITGWLFNVSDATDSYIFIVFIINKMMGIFILPFLLVIAFTSKPLHDAAFILSWFGIGFLLIYRFILSYGAVRKEVKLNSFHFILYILGFEVIPLLLIYKLLLLFF